MVYENGLEANYNAVWFAANVIEANSHAIWASYTWKLRVFYAFVRQYPISRLSLYKSSVITWNTFQPASIHSLRMLQPTWIRSTTKTNTKGNETRRTKKKSLWENSFKSFNDFSNVPAVVNMCNMKYASTEYSKGTQSKPIFNAPKRFRVILKRFAERDRKNQLST